MAPCERLRWSSPRTRSRRDRVRERLFRSESRGDRSGPPLWTHLWKTAGGCKSTLWPRDRSARRRAESEIGRAEELMREKVLRKRATSPRRVPRAGFEARVERTAEAQLPGRCEKAETRAFRGAWLQMERGGGLKLSPRAPEPRSPSSQKHTSKHRSRMLRSYCRTGMHAKSTVASMRQSRIRWRTVSRS